MSYLQERKLKEKLADLKKQLASIVAQDPYQRESYADENTQDDDAAEREEHTRVEALKKNLEVRIKKVEGALNRLKAGTYEFCSNCGKRIDKARLEIIPETNVCVSCNQENH